ncbi:MAG: hypothetical protein DI538_22975 [Azospira oryzae]|nr:MAG: hypothetical protein DI538_22975 [Azospira oryzae]
MDSDETIEIHFDFIRNRQKNYEIKKEKFGNGLTGIVYSTLVFRDEQENRNGKISGKGKKGLVKDGNEEKTQNG